MMRRHPRQNELSLAAIGYWLDQEEYRMAGRLAYLELRGRYLLWKQINLRKKMRDHTQQTKDFNAMCQLKNDLTSL